MLIADKLKIEEMAELTLKEIIEATGGELLSEGPQIFCGVSIDSRTISDGEVFFAIRGDNFDGHEFLEKALVKAGCAVIDEKPDILPEGRAIVHVADTLRSLQDLACSIRKKAGIPVVGVTGSNGKTTTKEMIHAVISHKFRTLKNEGNLNNHIGLPLSLLKLAPEHEAAVLEMGMNARGEIRRLCEIAVPTHGVITNIGQAHMGRLGSYEAVRDAKLEIMEGLGTAVVNGDDEFLMKGIEALKDFSGRVITFGIETDADIKAENITPSDKGTELVLKMRGGGSAAVKLNVHGLFNVYNALAAAGVAFSLGMTADEIKAGLEGYDAFSMRFEIIQAGEVTVINDAYNANPSSMEVSLRELQRLGAGGRTVAVLGDMKELDAFSADAHKDLVTGVIDSGIDVFISVGPEMCAAAEEGRSMAEKKDMPEIYVFEDSEVAAGEIMGILEPGDTVLIKGSRSVLMEKITGRITDAV